MTNMRMWMINPKCLCNQHLLGEHGEIHKFKHTFEKGYSIKNRISPVVQIEPASMRSRHDDLAIEMLNRGMNHKSDYTQPCLAKYESSQINVKADLSYNKKDLAVRCSGCKEKMTKETKWK